MTAQPVDVAAVAPPVDAQVAPRSATPRVPAALACESWPVAVWPALCEKLFAAITVTDSGCWVTDFWRNENGYAYVRAHGRDQRLHRVVWQLTRGPIPDGMVLDQALTDEVKRLRAQVEQHDDMRLARYAKSETDKARAERDAAVAERDRAVRDALMGAVERLEALLPSMAEAMIPSHLIRAVVADLRDGAR